MSVIGVEYRLKKKKQENESKSKESKSERERERERKEDAPQLNSMIIPSFHHKTIRHTIEIIKSLSYLPVEIFT